jgi:hypothetical protein
VARSPLEVHHVVHWADGGGTDLENLAWLCPSHHDGHHRGEFSITGDANAPGGLVFLARGGFAIGPGPTYAPAGLRGGPATRSAGPTQGSAGRGCALGVSTLRADGANGADGPAPVDDVGDLNDVGDLEDLGYPDEDADPEPDGRDERWPGVVPPVAYQGATGEVLHSKWVTFHEGPALLL